MKIFITGGLGVLGWAIRASLPKHELFWFDNYSDDEDVIHDSDHCQVMDISDHNKFLFQCVKHKPDVVIHLAEMASIDPLLQSSSLRASIVGTSQVLHACAIQRIHCLMGTWIDVVQPTDIPTSAIVWRQQLIKHYNRGNTVITEIRLPRIISTALPSSSWGSIISRFINHAEFGTPLTCDVSEYTPKRIYWCSLEEAARPFCEFLMRNTRTPQYAEGYKATIAEVIGCLLDIYNMDEVEMRFPYADPIRFARHREVDNTLSRWLKEEVDALRERTAADAATDSQQGRMGTPPT